MTTEMLLSVFALVVSTLLAVLGFVSRYAIEQRDKNTDARLDALEDKKGTGEGVRLAEQVKLNDRFTSFSERLHQDELQTVKLQGDLALIREKNGTIERAVEAIEQNMVRREDLERIEKSIDGIHQDLRLGRAGLGPGRYASPYGGTPAYGGSPATPPPPKERK